MKSLLTLLLLTSIAFSQQVAVQSIPVSHVTDGERVLLIKGQVAGDWKSWLVIEGHNGADWKEKGFEPSYTRIICDYVPMFRKLPNGQWEIMFRSEIAKDLP